MFEFEACEVFKIKEFTFVNDCFKYERNEETGHYGQILITPSFHQLLVQPWNLILSRHIFQYLLVWQ